MKSKPLSETNPYLCDIGISEKLVTVNVSTSTAIELGIVSSTIIKAIKGQNSPQLIFYPLAGQQ